MTDGGTWSPPRDQIDNSNLMRFIRACGLESYAELCAKSEGDSNWMWEGLQDFYGLRFEGAPAPPLESESGSVVPTWFRGQTTNVADLCLDRHVAAGDGDRPVYTLQNEDETKLEVTYGQLADLSCTIANALKRCGVGAGDVVALCGAMHPDLVATLFAAARIGAVLSPFSTALSPASIVRRLRHVRPKVFICSNSVMRRGQSIGLWRLMHEALGEASVDGMKVVVHTRQDEPASGADAPGAAQPWSSFTSAASGPCPAEKLPADAPLLVLYTSGTTGEPKGTVHTHAGLILKAAFDFGLIFDLKRGDRMLRVADFGWVSGPITCIASTLLGAHFYCPDGAPDFPLHTRVWKLVAAEKISIASLLPAYVRNLMRVDRGEVKAIDLSSLRIVTSGSEAWTEEGWQWSFANICRGNVPLLNLSGGTEVAGGILATPITEPIKPCSVGFGLPAMGVDVVDERGQSVARGMTGELVMRRLSVSLTRGLYKAEQLYIDSYWSRHPGIWSHGDEVYVDADGYCYVVGRTDDMMKVQGKRIAPSEVEEELCTFAEVREAAVVAFDRDGQGTALHCACVLRDGARGSGELAERIQAEILARFGKTYRIHEVRFVSHLPKSKSLKLLRRVVRTIWQGGSVDAETLLEPERLAELVSALHPATAKAALGQP